MADVARGARTCLRRNYGAVIVKNDVIVSTGYVGAPRGRANCIDLGTCIRQKLGIPRGERYEFCRSVHAEANAIIHASREQMLGATLSWSAARPPGRRAHPGRELLHYVQAHDHKRRHRKVVIRRDMDTYDIIDVQQWVDHDELLAGETGY